MKIGAPKSGVKSVHTLSSVEKQQQQQLQRNDPCRDDATLGKDWQKFCKTEIPELVRNQMRTIKELELELGEELVFGGPRGSLKVPFELPIPCQRTWTLFSIEGFIAVLVGSL